MIPTIAPPMPHLARIERDRAVGTAPSGQRLPPDYQLHVADLPCAFWEPTELPLGNGSVGLRTGPQVDVVAAGPRMLVYQDADVGVGDLIRNVRNADGSLITAGPLRTVVDHWRRTHREIGLEEAGARVAAEAS